VFPCAFCIHLATCKEYTLCTNPHNYFISPSTKLGITVPKSIADLKGWKKGTELKFVERSGYVCLIEEN